MSGVSRPRARDSIAEVLRKIETALLLIGAAACLLLLPHKIYGDGKLRYDALEDLMLRGSAGPDRYSIIQPVATIPLWIVGRVAGNRTWWCGFFNKTVFLLGLLSLHALLRNRADDGLVRRFLLLLMTASMFPYHLTTYYSEVLTAMLVAVGLTALTVGKPLVAGVALALGVANTPAAIGGLVCALAYHGWKMKKWIHAGLPVIAAAALITVENLARRGSPFATGYEGNHGTPSEMAYAQPGGFSYPLLFGVLSLLFSFGKGLAFWTPGLWLAPTGTPREDPLCSLTRCSLLFVGGLMLVYARWWAWHGDWFLGPRFLLFACIPASLLLAHNLSRPDVTLKTGGCALALLAASALVGINCGVFGHRMQDDSGLHRRYWTLYVPEYSPLFRRFLDHPPLAAPQIVFAAFIIGASLCVAAPAVASIMRNLERRS